MGSKAETPEGGAVYTLTLLGSFGLERADGERIAVSSKRSQALFALLATSPKTERARSWIESMLWCDRPADQAKASLRKELSNLRKLVNAPDHELVQADGNRIWLDREIIQIDTDDAKRCTSEQFLEGLDIAGEDAFEDWLRQQRARLENTSAEPEIDAQPATVSQTEPTTSTPAIAVLPLRLVKRSEQLDIAVHGLGEELINRLGRLRWLPVIARSSSFALGSGEIDPRTASVALGARYIVEGSVKTVPQGFTLSISLTDGDSGQSLWTDNIALDAIEDPQAIETALTGIAAALDHRIDQSEQMRALSGDEDNADLRQLIWKARWHLAQLSAQDLAEAEALLDQAAQSNPASSEVVIEKAWLTVRQLWLNRGTDADIRGLRKAAQRAILADPDDARGHMIAGIAEFWLQQPSRAEGLLKRAVELNPSLVMAHAQLGSALHHSGLADEAILCLETARRLSPNDVDLFFTEGELAMAHLALGNFDEAIDHAEASLARRAAYWSSHVAKINALVMLNRLEEARTAYAELMDSQPQFAPRFIDWLPYRDTSRNTALKQGLNQAASQAD